jgi:hypothetical protein
MNTEPKTKKSYLAGYIFLFAVGLEILALIFGGFAVALFGLIAFALGVLYMVFGTISNPEGMMAALKSVERMNEKKDESDA